MLALHGTLRSDIRHLTDSFGLRLPFAELKSSIDIQLSLADVAQPWRVKLMAVRQSDLLFLASGQDLHVAS
jgi:hypothetical protein